MKNIDPLNRRAWFETWFNSTYYHQLYAHRDEEEAADFIGHLLQKLEPPPHSKMLDIGCGAGRHSRALAEKGYDVTGFDIALNSIMQARRYTSENLRFWQHDMRKPFGRQQFHYIFNFFTSIGYFPQRKENENVIGHIAAALKPGGLALIDYVNIAQAEECLVQQEEKEIDGIVYTIERWADTDFLFKNISILEDGRKVPVQFREQISRFYLRDFEQMFSSYPLELIDVFGDYQLQPYDEKTSKRMIMLVKKISLYDLIFGS